MLDYFLRFKLQRLLILFPVLLITSGCARNDVISSAEKNQTDVNDQASQEQPAAIKILDVDENRCTGCGKCSRFDPEHFAISQETRKATVVSQKNLESNDLRFAISACQDRAIALK